MTLRRGSGSGRQPCPRSHSAMVAAARPFVGPGHRRATGGAPPLAFGSNRLRHACGDREETAIHLDGSDLRQAQYMLDEPDEHA